MEREIDGSVTISRENHQQELAVDCEMRSDEEEFSVLVTWHQEMKREKFRLHRNDKPKPKPNKNWNTVCRFLDIDGVNFGSVFGVLVGFWSSLFWSAINHMKFESK